MSNRFVWNQLRNIYKFFLERAYDTIHRKKHPFNFSLNSLCVSMLLNKKFSKNQDLLLSVKDLGTIREVFFSILQVMFFNKKSDWCIPWS